VLSPKFLILELVWFAIAGGLLAGAYRAKLEWPKAALASFALSILAWRTLAVIPSWWLYYGDTVLKWGGQGCVSLSTGKDAISCLKQTARDLVVVIELGAGFTGFLVAFMMYQKKFPKQLAPGEPKPEATGGYK
jgi:hypothetical protein